jgi:uncharacterized OB-fold protein
MSIEPSLFRPETWSELDEDRVALRVVRCLSCKLEYLPHVDICPECLGTSFSFVDYDRGVLYTFTTIEGNGDPVFVGYVDLPGGARVFGRLDASARSWVRCDAQVVFRVGSLGPGAAGGGDRLGYVFAEGGHSPFVDEGI